MSWRDDLRNLLLTGGCALLATTALPAANVAPAAVQPLADRVLPRAGAALDIDLAPYFSDPDVPGTAVRIAVRIGDAGAGNIDLALFDQQAPLTVANFVSYINAGRYANNVLHRLQHNFVIQGGGYYFVNNTTVGLVPTFATVPNEPGISNRRGTIAMAKVGSDPNSATSQWFINLSDDNVFLDQPPPVSNSFTVFGRVVGNGMAVVDQIAALNSYDAASASGIPAWNQLPLTAPSLQRIYTVETNASIIPALAYSAISENPALVTVSVTEHTLRLTPSSTLRGHTTITVTATDLDGAEVQATFGVDVVETFANWAAGYSFASPADATEEADPDHDGYPNLVEFAFGGDPLLAGPITGAPVAEPGGGLTFFQRVGTGLSYAVYESPDLAAWTRVWQTGDGFGHPFIALNSAILGYNILTIRDPSGLAARRFWKVEVTKNL